MSVLTCPSDVSRALHKQPQRTLAQRDMSSHVAMLKRFAKFTLALVGFAIAVTAIASAKLAIYWPHHFH